MYEYDLTFSPEYYIWMSRQIAGVQPISKPQTINEPAYRNLQLGVLGSHASHSLLPL